MVSTIYDKEKYGNEKLIVFVSGGTGLASESVGLSLISQFEGFANAQCENLPYVDTIEKVQNVIGIINEWALVFKEVVVFSTFAEPRFHSLFQAQIQCAYFDIFASMLPVMSQTLNRPIEPFKGVTRRLNKKDERAQAIDYALEFDDGQKLNFEDADIILLGLSRSGKTPTALWLALHYGLNAANYPITEDDFDKNKLPEGVINNLHKCVLLVPSLARLNQLREERFQGSNYASVSNCKRELNLLHKLRHIETVPQIDVSNKSIEEIATHALSLRNIHPKGRF